MGLARYLVLPLSYPNHTQGVQIVAANINLTLEEITGAANALTTEINETGAIIQEALAGLAEAVRAFKPCECPIGSETPPEDTVEGDPPPEGFVEYDPLINDRKCKLANMTFDDILSVTRRLKEMGVENASQLGIGTTGGIVTFVFGLLAAGPVGWGMSVLGAITGTISFFLVQAIDLDALILILENEDAHEDIVNAMYNADSNTTALDAIKSVLSGYGATAVHLAYLDTLHLLNGLTALFFQPDGEQGVLINQRLDGFVSLVDCTPEAAPTDWMIIPEELSMFAAQTASGQYGSGVIDQAIGEQWTLTAEERTDLPGNYILGVVVRHFWDNLGTPARPGLGPVTALPLDGLQSHSFTGTQPTTMSNGRADVCDGTIFTDGQGTTIPSFYPTRLYFAFQAPGPFTITFSIRETPTICP